MSVIRTDTAVCVQNSLLVSITVRTLELVFSWAPEITGCESAENRMCLIRSFTACLRFPQQQHDEPAASARQHVMWFVKTICLHDDVLDQTQVGSETFIPAQPADGVIIL